MPTNIQALIDAIPIAEDDHVITSEYHNKLRDAIRALAGLGQTPGVASRVLTLAPAFYSDNPNAFWEQPLGRAHKGNAAASGWFPVQLPDGAHIEKLSVTCKRTGVPGALTVRLIKQYSNEANAVVVATARFEAAASPSTGTFNPNATEVFSTSAIGAFNLKAATNIQVLPLVSFFTGLVTADGKADADHDEVDGDFKYLIEAKLDAPAGTAAAAGGDTEIVRIQISYTA